MCLLQPDRRAGDRRGLAAGQRPRPERRRARLLQLDRRAGRSRPQRTAKTPTSGSRRASTSAQRTRPADRSRMRRADLARVQSLRGQPARHQRRRHRCLLLHPRQTRPKKTKTATRVKIYDARSLGGYPFVPPEPQCKASDECHGAGTPIPPPPDIKSVASTPGGNVTTAEMQARRFAEARRCVRKQRTHKKHHRSGTRGGSDRWLRRRASARPPRALARRLTLLACLARAALRRLRAGERGDQSFQHRRPRTAACSRSPEGLGEIVATGYALAPPVAGNFRNRNGRRRDRHRRNDPVHHLPVEPSVIKPRLEDIRPGLLRHRLRRTHPGRSSSPAT